MILNWRLEGERDAAADSALALREDEHGAVAQHEGTIALSEEIPDIENRFNATGAVAVRANRLAEMEAQKGLVSIGGERGNLRHGVAGLPPITCVPSRAGSLDRA